MLINNANLALLAILDGYDAQATKSPELLSFAMKVSNWIGKCQEGCDPRNLTLNRLQIVKRERKLRTLEMAELVKIIEPDVPADLRCAASLLLDDVISAQEFFNEMPPEQQKEFLTYPICRFGNLAIRET